jgi:hypothetical protein
MLRVTFAGFSTSANPAIGYSVGITRVSDGYTLDWDDGEFKASGHVEGRREMTENDAVPGLWQLYDDLPADLSEAVTVSIVREPAGLLITTYEILVVDGEPATHAAADRVWLSSDTGGVDALTLVDSDGEPIEDAIVSVFLTSEYEDEEVETPVPVALTTTNARGRMRTRIALAAGYSYTIHWQRQGALSTPVTEEVTL